jgi:hypothetical protein
MAAAPWAVVPTISRFHGITITMYFKEHGHPHFHARADGREASIRIDPVEVIEGELDRRRLSLVKLWAKLHRSELEKNWLRARAREKLLPIEPLR